MPKQAKKEPENIISIPKETISDESFMEYLKPNHSIDLKIKEIVDDLPESYAIVIILPGEKHELRYLRLLNHFVEQGIGGIYVTLNNSTHELLEEMRRQKIESKNIVFIDAVTKMIEGQELSGNSYTYLESPSDLVELGVEIEHAMSSLKGKGFVIIDSITTLLMYNKEVSVEKFLHSLSQKIKDLDLQGIFLAAESTNKDAIDTISQFCDDVKKI
jgi:KaiC/GvpD/RAD55 family RecA-like ATPase